MFRICLIWIFDNRNSIRIVLNFEFFTMRIINENKLFNENIQLSRFYICDERASISTFEINIWSVIKIHIFILSHRITESNLVYDQIFYICFVRLSVFVSSLRYSRVIM